MNAAKTTKGRKGEDVEGWQQPNCTQAKALRVEIDGSDGGRGNRGNGETTTDLTGKSKSSD